jgi:hypothetical protein
LKNAQELLDKKMAALKELEDELARLKAYVEDLEQRNAIKQAEL